MRWLRIVLARIRGLLQHDAIAAEIREELQFHLSMRIEQYEDEGLSPDAARRRAQRRVGNIAVHQDCGYDIRGGGVMETIVQDIRYSVRLFLEQRGFALVAVLTLAIAIGAVTAVVSVIDAAILRPLPYPEPEQIVNVGITVTMEDGRERRATPSIADIRGWLALDDVISAGAASRRSILGQVVGGEQPERVQVTEATEGLLRTYGVAPLHGRDLRLEDTLPGAAPVVILGYGYWQSRFGGDPDVVGETLRIDGQVVTIVGVLPAHFGETELLRPLRFEADRLSMRNMGTNVEARLASGITPAQAAERLSARIDETLADRADRPSAVNLTSVLASITGRRWTTVNVLSGAVCLILLLACVNVAGLQLARGAVRRRELAVRASLGAGRARLVRQLMIENGVLAAAGAMVGIFVAWSTLGTLVANLPLSLPSSRSVSLNPLVLATTALVTIAATMLFGLIPALRLSRPTTAQSLSSTGTTHGSSLTRRTSQLLIAAEIAVAVVLVVGASLMLRSFSRIMAVDIGIDPAAFLTLKATPITADPAVHAEYYPALLRELRLIPGVQAAGAVDHLPMGGSSTIGFFEVQGESHSLNVRTLLPGYTDAVGIPLIAGRMLTDADVGRGAKVAVISESAAREMFPETSAIGRTLNGVTLDEQGERVTVPWEVVGVIGDVRYNGPLYGADPEVFFPFGSFSRGATFELALGMTMVVRPSADAEGIARRLREVADGLGTPVVVERIRSGEEWLGEKIVTPRQRTVLLGVLGGIGLLLALVGVFGLTGYAVARRTREIGVRMTFGARPRQVVGSIVRDSAVPVFAGIALGLLGGYFATRLIESFLFETAPTEPTTFAAVALLLGLTGCLAAWIPARRAARVDPVSALRVE